MYKKAQPTKHSKAKDAPAHPHAKAHEKAKHGKWMATSLASGSARPAEESAAEEAAETPAQEAAEGE